MSPLSINQYSAVTRRTYPGLNYEALAAQRGYSLPATYAQRDQVGYQNRALDVTSAANRNTADYYRNAIDIQKQQLADEAERFAKEYELKVREIEEGVAAANEANRITAEGYKSNYDAAMAGVDVQKQGLALAQENAILARQQAEEEAAAAEKAQMTSNILGGAGLIVSGYGAYKTGLAGDTLNAILANKAAGTGVTTPVGTQGPGLSSNMVLENPDVLNTLGRENVYRNIDGKLVNDLGQEFTGRGVSAPVQDEIGQIIANAETVPTSLAPTSEGAGLAAQPGQTTVPRLGPGEMELLEGGIDFGTKGAVQGGTEAAAGQLNIGGSVTGGVAPETAVSSAQTSALGSNTPQLGPAETTQMLEGISPTSVGETATGAGGAEAGASGLSGAATVVGYVAAADLVRQKWGDIETPYEERNPIEKFASTPGIEAAMPGSTLINSLVGNNDANFLVKASNKMGRIEENIVGKPLDSIFNFEWTWDDNFVTKFDQGIKDSTNMVFGEDVGNVMTYVFNPIGTLTNVFCFVAGTRISMSDGTCKNVEDLKIYDNILLGGIVTGTGMVLAEDIYEYKGTKVQGDHAVFDNGVWYRVRDHEQAIKLELPEPVIVYPIVSEDHLIVINGTVYSDMVEIDNAYQFNDYERLVLLNKNKTRNDFIQEFINESGNI